MHHGLMGLPGWVVRKIADGEAPSPWYAGIGLLDASQGIPAALAAALGDPAASLSGLRGAWRDPVRRYDALVERGYVRVVRDGAEVAVRRQVRRFDDELVGPARAAAGLYAKGRSRRSRRAARSR